MLWSNGMGMASVFGQVGRCQVTNQVAMWCQVTAYSAPEGWHALLLPPYSAMYTFMFVDIVMPLWVAQ